MDCERFQIELEDLLDGELEGRRAAKLRAHLESCADCRQVERELRREAEVFARYRAENELTPSPAMWEAIRDRIRTEAPAPAPRSSWRDRLAMGALFGMLLRPAVLRQVAAAAALVVLTVAATIFFTGRFADQNGDGGNVAVVAPSPAPSASPALTPQPDKDAQSGAAASEIARVQDGAPTPSATPKSAPKNLSRPLPKTLPKRLSDEEVIRAQVARAEREYVNAIRLLDRAIAERKGQIDPKVFAQYESSLALIDESIARSRRALHEQPGDAAAGSFLLAAYARKVELMQEIALR